jgi:hypothetical protein
MRQCAIRKGDEGRRKKPFIPLPSSLFLVIPNKIVSLASSK